MTHSFIDTHCHFDFPPFSGEETSSIARAAEAGVRAIIVPAIEAARFEKVLALAQSRQIDAILVTELSRLPRVTMRCMPRWVCIRS